jgi:hypothetical protein
MSPVDCTRLLERPRKKDTPIGPPEQATLGPFLRRTLRRKQMQNTYTLGSRTFILDQDEAEAALEAKRVIGGRETMTFNLLPLRRAAVGMRRRPHATGPRWHSVAVRGPEAQ